MVLNMAFTKVHQSILQSSLWCEDSDTKVVWITLLALADKHGEVAGSIPGLARTAGVPLERCQAAIAKFLSPDPFSRTPDNEGRRLEAIDGGWALVNYAKYRHEASKEDAKERNAKRQQRHRDKALLGVTRNASSRSVTQNRDIAEAEAEADKDIGGKPPSPHDAPSIPKPRMRLEKPTLEMCIANAAEIGLPADEADQFLNHHEARGWKGIVDWKAAMRTWRGNWKKWGGDSKQPALASKPKPMFVQIKELEARIDTHPGNWNWLKYNSKTATKEQKDEYKALLKQLEAMQAGQEPLPIGEYDIP